MDDKKMDTDNYYLPPEKKGGFESFAKFLYNAETGQIIGRTPSSWDQNILYAQERSPRGHSPGSLSVFRNSSTPLKTETGNKLNFSNGKESAPAVKLFHPRLEENRR
ncbi:hypothetical protein M8J77_020334 [Diaphorina citri]|nr:hypothetical protein M8J77_020334 [Diaphorina citri]